MYGKYKTNVNIDIFVDTILTSGNKTSYTNRTSFSDGKFDNTGGGFSYLHNFPKSGHQLSGDLNYNKSRNNSSNITANNVYAVSRGLQTSTYKQHQLNSGDYEQLTGQT